MFIEIYFFCFYILNLVYNANCCSCSHLQYASAFCKAKFAAYVVIRSGPFRLHTGNISSLTNHLNQITNRMLLNESSNLLSILDTNFYYKVEIHQPFKLNDQIKFRNDRRNYIRLWIHNQPGNSCNLKLKINQLYLIWTNLNDDNEPIANFCNTVIYEHIKPSNRDLLNRIAISGLKCR